MKKRRSRDSTYAAPVSSQRDEDPVPVVPETELTVAALAERFMRVHVEAHCKPRTVTTYRSVLERHIRPAFGAMAPGAVGRR